MSLIGHRSAFRALTSVGVVSLLLVGTLLVLSPAQAQKVRPIFFGMHDSRITSGSLPGVRVGAVRLWDTGTSWRHIERLPGQFSWDALDRAVDTARDARVRPMLVLGQTPQFWAEDPLAPGAYGDGASSMPNIVAWERYVGEVANRYGNRIDYQIWNEPNVLNYWSGTVGEMAKLTATASKTIKSIVGKKATIVAPAFPLRLKTQRTWYDRYWSAKVGGKSMASFVKVVAVNLYPLAHQAPEAQTKLISFAKRALPKAARRKPMWNTEINYGLLGGGAAKEISEAKQAAYVGRTLALNATSPIRRMYWYAWGIGPIANTHLVEDDRTTLTRAGRAWGVARGWLVGTKTTKCVKTKRGKLKGLYTCTATKGKREVRRIYWKPSGKNVRIKTHKTTKRWSNLAGNTTTRKGRYPIRVGMSPVMVASRR